MIAQFLLTFRNAQQGSLTSSTSRNEKRSRANQQAPFKAMVSSGTLVDGSIDRNSLSG